MTGADDAVLNEAVLTAQTATHAGRLDDAATMWRQVLTLSPEHPQALFFFGQRALAQGDPKTARDFLTRAAAVAAKEPMIWLNLSYALQALNDPDGELRALTGALTADPYCYPALLAKASLAERVGRPRQAAQIYKDALKILPPERQIFPALKAAVAHGRKVLGEDQADLDVFLEARLADVRRKHDGADTRRFDESKEVMVGRTKVFTQQPTKHHFPALPAIAFYDRKAFPWLAAVEAKTDAIRDELRGLLLRRSGDFTPYVNRPPGAPLDDWVALNGSTQWSVLFLWDDGAPLEDNCRQCPETTAVMRAAPLADVPNAAPNVFFSCVAPHTHIPPHTGVSNTRLIVHLPLVVPDNCRFRVGNEIREWRVGEALIFDDTIEHEVWNDSDELRVVLIFDIWNPFLTEVERDLSRVLVDGFNAYYKVD